MFLFPDTEIGNVSGIPIHALYHLFSLAAKRQWLGKTPSEWLLKILSASSIFSKSAHFLIPDVAVSAEHHFFPLHHSFKNMETV